MPVKTDATPLGLGRSPTLRMQAINDYDFNLKKEVPV